MARRWTVSIVAAPHFDDSGTVDGMAKRQEICNKRPLFILCAVVSRIIPPLEFALDSVP